MSKPNNDKVEINIDVTDWSDEYNLHEPDLTTLENAIEFQQSTGAKPQQMGRLLVIDHERNGEKSINKKPHKVTLLIGSAFNWSRLVGSQKKDVQLENGKEVKVRSYVAQVVNHPDNEAIIKNENDELYNGPELVETVNNQAAYRAEMYIKYRAMGFIVERLKIIAANRGDVKAVGEWIKGEIDRVVERLS